MRNPKDEGMEEADDKAAERLKDFLRRRLPPGELPEELKPKLVEKGTNTEQDGEQPAAQDVQCPSAGKNEST